MLITNLLTNMILLSLNGVIPTNTPAFQSYSFHVMVTNAFVVASKLGWDYGLISTDKVTEFWAKPLVTGTLGGICFSNRYQFWYRNGLFAGCTDRSFDAEFMNSGDAKHMRAVVKQWRNSGDQLSRVSARTIAESTLRSIVLAREDMDVGALVRTQLAFDDSGGEPALPYYVFCWKSALPVLSAVSSQVVYDTAQIDVSGVSARVARVSCQAGEIVVSGRSVEVLFGQSYFPCPKMSKPTNYMEMLGLPANTLFVRRKLVGDDLSEQQPVYETFPGQSN
jgi:hypothetical protein